MPLCGYEAGSQVLMILEHGMRTKSLVTCDRWMSRPPGTSRLRGLCTGIESRSMPLCGYEAGSQVLMILEYGIWNTDKIISNV